MNAAKQLDLARHTSLWVVKAGERRASLFVQARVKYGWNQGDGELIACPSVWQFLRPLRHTASVVGRSDEVHMCVGGNAAQRGYMKSQH